MEATLCNCKISNSLGRPLIPQTSKFYHIAKLCQVQKNLKGYTSTKLGQNGQLRCGMVMGCAKSGDSCLAEMEAKMNAEEHLDFVIDEKCQGKRGIVELMECLESETIKGENEGKEASDYIRRAQIFDKSDQVFKALKEETKTSPQES